MSTPPTWPPPPPPPPPQAPPGVPGARRSPAPPPKKSSAVPIVVILIVVVFGGIFVIGIVAAIAIPGLLRARMGGNEASAIGTMRAMSSAQATFAATHEGRYGTLECLTAPSSCPERGRLRVDGAVPESQRRRARSAQRLHVPAVRVARPEPLRVLGRTRSGRPVRRARVLRHRTFTVLEYLDYRARGPFAPADAEEGCPAGGRTL